MNVLKSINPENFKWFDYERYSFSLGLNLNNDLYLSGHSASEYSSAEKKIVVKGDMADQTNTALDKIEAILRAENKSLSDTTHLVENITMKGLKYYKEYDAVISQRLPKNFSRQLVIVDSLLRPDAFVELEIRLENVDTESDSVVSLPTLLLMASVCSSMKEEAVQSPTNPQIPSAKFESN